MLGGREVLPGEEDHLVVEQGLPDGRHRRRIERLMEVHVADLGADGPRQRGDVERDGCGGGCGHRGILRVEGPWEKVTISVNFSCLVVKVCKCADCVGPAARTASCATRGGSIAVRVGGRRWHPARGFSASLQQVKTMGRDGAGRRVPVSALGARHPRLGLLLQLLAPRLARRSWVVRAMPTARTRKAPARAATRSATATGICPFAAKNSTRTERVFCTMKSIRAAPSTTATPTATQAPLMRVWRAPSVFGLASHAGRRPDPGRLRLLPVPAVAAGPVPSVPAGSDLRSFVGRSSAAANWASEAGHTSAIPDRNWRCNGDRGCRRPWPGALAKDGSISELSWYAGIGWNRSRQPQADRGGPGPGPGHPGARTGLGRAEPGPLPGAVGHRLGRRAGLPGGQPAGHRQADGERGGRGPGAAGPAASARGSTATSGWRRCTSRRRARRCWPGSRRR